MVVSLNDSDDSDSDMDACSSTQTVFGGLEFMIKEARRTVEVGANRLRKLHQEWGKLNSCMSLHKSRKENCVDRNPGVCVCSSVKLCDQ